MTGEWCKNVEARLVELEKAVAVLKHIALNGDKILSNHEKRLLWLERAFTFGLGAAFVIRWLLERVPLK